MLDWLNTLPKSESTPPPESAQDSGEIQGLPVFPVSRFRETPSRFQNRPESRMDKGFPVFPVEKTGGPEIKPNAGTDCEEKGGGIPEHLPDFLDAMAAILDPAEVDELRSMAAGNPEQAAEVCRLILAAPPFPTAVDAAELDRLIVQLCDLEPWLVGYLPEMQAARLAMAPARYPLELSRFRAWVKQAEEKHGAAPMGAGQGNPSAP